MSEHVAVEPTYALPTHLRFVEDYLRLRDPWLRLRRSASTPGFFVLERRCRRTRPAHTSRRVMTDTQVQARDGYAHVSTVHPWFLDRPRRIVEKLMEEGHDLHEVPARDLAKQLDEEDRYARITRHQRRLDNFRAKAAESFDVLDRTGNTVGAERYRISNVGLPAPTSAGETPAQESSDVHSVGASDAR